MTRKDRVQAVVVAATATVCLAVMALLFCYSLPMHDHVSIAHLAPLAITLMRCSVMDGISQNTHISLYSGYGPIAAMIGFFLITTFGPSSEN